MTDGLLLKLGGEWGVVAILKAENGLALLVFREWI